MPKKIPITNENNDFQHLDAVKRNRQKRSKFKEFFVEGIKPIELAIANKWKIKAFIYDPKREHTDRVKNILTNSAAEINFEIKPELMEKLTDKEEVSEILAIIEMPQDDLARIPIRKDLLILLLDRPASPGNLGTIIRTADAFKADGVIITGHAADLYDAKTIRASLGTVFSIPVIRIGSHNELLPWFSQIKKKVGELSLVGTSAKYQNEISKKDFKKPTVLLFGNETTGLSQQYKELCDVVVKIPISGSASSLNLAEAASIALYEVWRQRGPK